MPAGAPLGNKNGTKNRIWSDAVRRALLAQDGEALRKCAESLVKKALAGDIPALKEIGDRIDGKAVQAVEHQGDASFLATLLRQDKTT